MIKLNLGCGRGAKYFFPDYINVDMIKHEGVDVVSRVEKLPFEDNYADEIYASHILEHFVKFHTRYILKEWIRVLKPGGLIRIVVPNTVHGFLLLMEKCLVNGINGDIVREMYGGQKGDTLEESISNSHLTGFDVDILRWEVEHAGIIVEDCFYGKCDDLKRRHPSTWERKNTIRTTDICLIGKKPNA